MRPDLLFLHFKIWSQSHHNAPLNRLHLLKNVGTIRTCTTSVQRPHVRTRCKQGFWETDNADPSLSSDAGVFTPPVRGSLVHQIHCNGIPHIAVHLYHNDKSVLVNDQYDTHGDLRYLSNAFSRAGGGGCDLHASPLRLGALLSFW